MNFLKNMIKWRKYWIKGMPMEQIGKVFRQLRESRNISLRQATGGQFSPSMLSRFETGQSELSVEKFLFALENISASVEEILFSGERFSVWYRFWVEKRNHRCLGSKEHSSSWRLVSQGVSKACPFSKQTETYSKCHYYQVLYEEHGWKGRVNSRGRESPSWLFVFYRDLGNLWTQFIFQSVLPFYLFLFLLGMYEKWSANLIF